MGYCVDRKVCVTFSKSKEKEFIELFNKFMNKAPSRGYHWGQSGAFDPEEYSFTEILEEWSYPIEEDEKDPTKYRVTDFEGEKEGDDGSLWEALAPVIDSGSYIENNGEDHDCWRWVFKDGGFEEKWPEVSWD